jgi:type I restriction enzyme M protein
VKTSVLVFSRPAAGENPTDHGSLITPHSRSVLFYDIKNDGYDPDKVSGGGRVETPQQNGIPALIAAWKEYKASNFQNPPGPEANTLLEADAPEPVCWWATLDRLADSGYNLSASAYKPTSPTRTNAEDPLKLVDELLTLEAAITNGLTELRKQLL